MSAIIWRNVGKYTHFLNCKNGQIVSFEIDGLDTEAIVSNPDNYKLNNKARDVFRKINGPHNSKLCHKNLIELGLAFHFPTTVNIELSRRCSLMCIHCYVGNKNLCSPKQSFFEQMDEASVINFFDELRDLGVFLIVVSGGEPFISKQLPSFLRIATEKGFLVEIFSNLQYLPEWFLSNKHENFRIGRIQTSVYSSISKIHDGITKSTGSLKRTLKNLYFLAGKGYLIEVATPLMRKNFVSWESTKIFFKKRGIVQNFSWPISNEYYGEAKKNRLNISSKNLRNFSEKNKDFISEKQKDKPSEHICEAGKAIFAISANGDIFPCSQLPLSVGNITSKIKMKKIIYGENMLKIGSLKWRDVLAKKVFNFCPGVNYTDTGNMLTQPKHILSAIMSFPKKEVN